MADQVNQENLANKVKLDPQETQGSEDSLASKATEENLELQELREKMESRDHLDVTVKLGKRVFGDLQGQKDF